MEWIKKHVFAIAAFVSALATIIGASFTIDQRYAKATDIEPIRELSVRGINQVRIEQANSIDTLRKQQIEDRLFELRLRQQPSTLDQALIRRYEDQLREITENIRSRNISNR
jgi:hypothetical protein